MIGGVVVENTGIYYFNFVNATRDYTSSSMSYRATCIQENAFKYKISNTESHISLLLA